MDTRGARHLKARLAVGAPVGERVEVVSVAPGASVDVEPGDAGQVVAIEDGFARVLLDRGTELVVDPTQVRLRRCA
jgi:hypothetical protein